MSENKMLSQEEIDALLKGPPEGEPEENFLGEAEGEFTAGNDLLAEQDGSSTDNEEVWLDEGEKDALGEIGNITMGTASTALSELLRQKVSITSPNVFLNTQDEFIKSFKVPYILIQVEFTAGLEGFSILVIRVSDAAIIADLMMGGTGENVPEELNEIGLSAASEAMNQMIGSAATSLATLFGRSVNISPPVTTVLQEGTKNEIKLPSTKKLVTVSFDLKIGELVDTEIMQVLSIETAKKEAALLWQNMVGAPVQEEEEVEDDSWLSKDLWSGESAGEDGGELEAPDDLPFSNGLPDFGHAAPPPDTPPAPVRQNTPPVNQQPAQKFRPAPIKETAFSFSGLDQSEQRKLELLLDVPLKVSVILGRTKRPIKEVLNLTPGAIVELNSLVDEPVEVLVNGTLVARGEVVVVNENFGVRINNIISPEERLMSLRE